MNDDDDDGDDDDDDDDDDTTKSWALLFGKKKICGILGWYSDIYF
jgi:hypothetical protein